ncbi:hypothetical protein RE6C_01354 [Rhodopirellula europaea 6C]|uniref:Uncharacterized protein n=2 Tax=Rhodopirellula TaxID=265488 RepID=M2B854_9BACT|nr:hypothetical protein RE6C_01354 [Rhodopirellula europaea 6C]
MQPAQSSSLPPERLDANELVEVCCLFDVAFDRLVFESTAAELFVVADTYGANKQDELPAQTQTDELRAGGADSSCLRSTTNPWQQVA